MDIEAWLRNLGLERYAAAFREHDVSAEVLSSLTAEDLKELGVVSVGHRRRMLEAIAALRAGLVPMREAGSVARSQDGESLDDGGVSASAAERRQVCVMFCDIVGFTALSSRLDPEDLSAVIRGYQSRVAGTITRFGGFIARYVGDGVLIYFGWPEAHEADAERAVRAGLAIIETINLSPVRTEALQVRIGIATGLVVVGEPIGMGEARQQTAIGETPNLAARLQSLAEPNSVVIDAATRRQIGGLFDCRDLGPVVLKGIPEPVHAWHVIGQASVESRFEALHPDTMTPLIGRDEELELLLRRWRQAKTGEGQVVLLSGEPGIGKSRLIAAFEEKLQDEPRSTLRYFSTPHHQDSALYPIINRWERDLKFSHGDTPQEKLHKLEAALIRMGTSQEDIALIASFLSVPLDDRYPVLDSNPQRLKERITEALMRQLARRAHRQPLLMVLEDAHWADASSLELVDKTISRLMTLPILLILSFRPEFQPPWVGLAAASLITLRRLTQKQAAHLATRIVVEQTLPPVLLERIVAQTDGIPLFIEELTKTVLEDAEQPDSNAALLKVPTTLQASLIARLDRLPAAKQVAQIGAVIGREFPHALLAVVAKLPEAQLAQDLDSLVASGLAFRRGMPPDAVYAFKHALVRDAAYGTLLRSQRQDLHRRIGEVLEKRFPDIVETQPEILAHHFAQAGLIDRAIAWWHRAGLRSLARSAHAEARAQFECALDLLGKLPTSEQRDAQELDLILGLAVPLVAIHGFGALCVEQCALRAMDLADRLHGSPSRFAACRLAWNSCLMRHPVPRTVALALDLIGLANEDRSPPKHAVAHRALGYSLLIAGEFRAADELLSRGAELADTISDREFTVYGEHPGMVCRAYRGEAKVISGFLTSGARLNDEAVAHARRDGNAHSLAWALSVAATVLQIHNEPERAIRFAAEVIEVARTHQLPQWLSVGERCLGWAMQRLGDVDAGLELQLRGLKRWYDTGAKLHTSQNEAALADSFLRLGEIATARAHLDAARAHCVKYGETYMAAEVSRLEGLLRRSEKADTEIVEGYLAQSLDTARGQGARLFELRTATTFARVLAERGERCRAVDLLAPVYSWFTEGFDTNDLMDAKATLDALG